MSLYFAIVKNEKEEISQRYVRLDEETVKFFKEEEGNYKDWLSGIFQGVEIKSLFKLKEEEEHSLRDKINLMIEKDKNYSELEKNLSNEVGLEKVSPEELYQY